MTNTTTADFPAYLAPFWARLPEQVFADPQTATMYEMELNECAGLALNAVGASANLQDDLLGVHITSPDLKLRRELFEMELPDEVAFKLAGTWNGVSFAADSATRFGRGGTSVTTVGFVTRDWQLLSQPHPRVWFGRLDGLDGLVSANAFFHEGRALFLRGLLDHDIAVVDVESRPQTKLLVIGSPTSIVPTRATIQRVLATLQFLFAQRLRVGVLRGVDVAGSPTHSMVGSAFGRYERASFHAHRPIPLTDNCWDAVAFEKLVGAMVSGPPIFRLATSYYLSSFFSDPDEAYLKLVVALEGLAIQVLSGAGNIPGVLNATATEFEIDRAPLALGASAARRDWHQWVATNPRWKNGKKLPEGQRVRAAFAVLDLILDAAMLEESNRWHAARHSAVAERTPNSSLDTRIGVLRTMLLGLLMRSQGYDGPIIGYARNARHQWTPAEQSWWGNPDLSADVPSAQKVYRLAT
ncbi:MAG: hypothetical protein IPK60_24470 [Sandaracinaceae bacterium]|nr:hypothetical protein [Sandaracinaceae bacterium]